MAAITIMSSNRNSGDLVLFPDGKHTKASRKETITWKLGKGCGVKSIANIYVKASPPSTNIFSELPHRDGSSDNWKAVVHKDADIGAEYNYDIFWLASDGTGPYRCDPKISVKPSPLFPKILLIIISVLFSVLFADWFFKRKSKSNLMEKNVDAENYSD